MLDYLHQNIGTNNYHGKIVQSLQINTKEEPMSPTTAVADYKQPTDRTALLVPFAGAIQSPKYTKYTK